MSNGKIDSSIQHPFSIAHWAPEFKSGASEPSVRAPRQTLSREEAYDATKSLWESLQGIAKNEEAWWVIQVAIDNAHDEGYRTGVATHHVHVDSIIPRFECSECRGDCPECSPDKLSLNSIGTVKGRDLEYL